MADDIARIGFKAEVSELIKARKELDRLANSGSKTEDSANKLSGSFRSLALQLGSTVSAFAALNKLTNVTRQFDVINAQLVTATGSAAKAGLAFKGIQQFATETPYDLAQVTESFVKLVNVGLNPSQRALTAYGDTAAAMGRDLGQFIDAVTKATTNEFESLKTFGIVAKTQGDNIAFTFKGVTTTVRKESKAIEGYLMALGENNFAGAMEQRMDSLDGAMSNLGDEWDKLFLNISQQGVGDAMEDSVRTAISALEELNTFIASGQLLATIDLIKMKFEGFTTDVLEMFGEIGSSWFDLASAIGERSVDLLTGAITKFPENMRAAIQLAAVEIGALVDYAVEYGSAFGQVFGVKLSQFVQSAGVYGRAIAHALNPFSSGEFDLEGELQKLSSISIEMSDEIFAKASANVDAITQARRDSIAAIIDERQAALDAADSEIEAIKQMAVEYKRVANEVVDLGSLVETTSPAKQLTSDVEKMIEQADNFGGAWSRTGSEIIDAFGNVADVFEDFAKRLGEIEELQTKLTAARAEYADGSEEALKIDKALANLQRESNKAQISGLGKTIGLSAQLFKENSRERKALHALEMGFLAAEIALSAQKALTNAVAAVSNQGSGDPYSAFARIAAMIGIMGGVLAAAGIAFGAGGGSYTAPEPGGTGTVLGDSGAQSASISNSLEMFEDIQIDQLAELRGIRSVLTQLGSGIERLAASVVTGLNFEGGGLQLGTISEGMNSTAGFLTSLSVMSKSAAQSGDLITASLADSIMKGFSSTKKKLLDSGIDFVSSSLGEIFTSGEVEANLFNVVETTKSSFWGLSKKKSTSTQLSPIQNAIAEQMGGIFELIGDSALDAATMLGLSTRDELSALLETFVVDIGKVSFKDKTGEEIQSELEAIFSQQADLISEFLVPAISEYQKIGEGAFETLQRVAMEQVVFIDNLERTGQSLQGLSAIMQIDVAQSVITLMGGLDKFSEAANTYFNEFFSESEQFDALQNSLSEAFEGLGLSLVGTREEFRSLVESLDLTTAEGQAMYAALLELSPAMAQYIDALGEQAEAADKAAQATDKAARSMADAALKAATTQYNNEKTRLDGLRRELDAEKNLRESKLKEAESALTSAFDSEISAIQSATQEQISAIESANSARISALNEEQSRIEENLQAMLGLVEKFDQRAKAVAVSDALSAARRGDFTLAQNLNVPTIGPEGFTNAVDFKLAQDIQANELQAISDLAQKEAIKAESQLTALDRQIIAIESSSAGQIAAVERNAAAQIAALENQRDSLLGVDNSVMTLEETIAAYQNAKMSLDELNYEEEIEKLDALVLSNEQVYELHKSAYEQEILRLDLILEQLRNPATVTIMPVSPIVEDAYNSKTPVLIETMPAPSQEKANEELKAEIVQMRRESQEAQFAIAKNSAATARILQRIELDGLQVSI